MNFQKYKFYLSLIKGEVTRGDPPTCQLFFVKWVRIFLKWSDLITQILYHKLVFTIIFCCCQFYF